MKVVCVNHISSVASFGLTFGKVYDVIPRGMYPFYVFHQDDCYVITNDSGKSWNYNKELFITLDEYRNLRINKILEE